MLGIAIYNSILVDAPFAKALWKKLAGEPLGLEDLHEAMPAVSRSLQAILKAARDSSDQAFHAAYGDLCFEASYEAFGAPQTAELVAGGADIPLSRANARAYVDAYVEWTLGTRARRLCRRAGISLSRVALVLFSVSLSLSLSRFSFVFYVWALYPEFSNVARRGTLRYISKSLDTLVSNTTLCVWPNSALLDRGPK